MGWLTDRIVTYEAYNQPLFAYPDSESMRDPILYGIIKDEDVMTHMQRAMISNVNMGHVRRFNNQVTDGTYPYGFPDTVLSFNVDRAEDLKPIVDSVYGEDMVIDYVKVGGLTDYEWILSQLYNGYGIQKDFTVITDSTVECISEQKIAVQNVGSAGGSAVGEIRAAFYVGDQAYLSAKWHENSGPNAADFPIDVGGKKPVGNFYVCACYSCWGIDGQNSIYRMWVYDVTDGTYPQLDIPEFNFGSETEYAEAFPSIPLRYKGVDYNDPKSTLDADAIKYQANIFGIKTELAIEEIMSNPDVLDNEHMMDNIIVNFGSRLWDESEAGRQYQYTMWHQVLEYSLEVGGDVFEDVECIETIIEDPYKPAETEDSMFPESPCSVISVKNQFTDYQLFFAGITNKYYTKAEVDADEELALIYYSDERYFNEGSLTKKYHSSTGAMMYRAGYRAMSEKQVQNYLDGNGVKAARRIPEGKPGWDRIKPSVKILNYSGIIYNDNGSTSSETELSPEYIYVKYLSGIRKIAQTPIEGTTSVTYYEIDVGGMDAITVHGIGGQVLVEDSDSETTAIVKIGARSTNGLTAPFFYGLAEQIAADLTQYHDAVDACVASLQLSFYVGDITTVELPWWTIALQVIALVIMICAAYLYIVAAPAMAGAAAVTIATDVAIAYAIMAGAFMFVFSAQIFKGLAMMSPWVALAVSVIIAVMGNWGGISAGIANIANMTIKQILNLLMAILDNVVKATSILMSESAQDELSFISLSSQAEKDQLALDNAGLLDGGNDYNVLAAIYDTGNPIQNEGMDLDKYFRLQNNVKLFGPTMLSPEDFMNIDEPLAELI